MADKVDILKRDIFNQIIFALDEAALLQRSGNVPETDMVHG